MSAMTKLDAKALEAAMRACADLYGNPQGERADLFADDATAIVRAYLDALPPAQSAGQIDRIEAKLDRVECKISSMSGLISNWVRARS